MSGSIELIVKSAHDVDVVISRVRQIIAKTIVAGAVAITLGRPTRSKEQNRLMWPLLTDFSKQVTHCGLMYAPEDWKDILTAAFEKQARLAPSLDGTGVVFLGFRTSKYSKKKFSQFIEFMYAEGSERSIRWSKASTENYESTRAAA